MARDDYKFADTAPETLVELMDWIDENTGLRGSATSGRAQFSAGGGTLMITSNRSSFDYQSPLLRHIEDSPNLRIKSVGIKQVRKNGDVEPHPSMNIEEA